MMRNLLLLAIILALAGVYTYKADFTATPAAQKTESEKETTFKPAPDFVFQILRGEKKNLSSFKGKIIVLNFWASWCTPCVVEFPQMLSLAQKTKGETVFIFLSVDEKSQDIERFLTRKQNVPQSDNVVIGWDKDKSIAQDLFQTYKFPETYIIDGNLMIRDKIIGAVEWDTREMENTLKSYNQSP